MVIKDAVAQANSHVENQLQRRTWSPARHCPETGVSADDRRAAMV